MTILKNGLKWLAGIFKTFCRELAGIFRMFTLCNTVILFLNLLLGTLYIKMMINITPVIDQVSSFCGQLFLQFAHLSLAVFVVSCFCSQLFLQLALFVVSCFCCQLFLLLAIFVVSSFCSQLFLQLAVFVLSSYDLALLTLAVFVLALLSCLHVLHI